MDLDAPVHGAFFLGDVVAQAPRAREAHGVDAVDVDAALRDEADRLGARLRQAVGAAGAARAHMSLPTFRAALHGLPVAPRHSRPQVAFTWPSKRTTTPGWDLSVRSSCARIGCDAGNGTARDPTNCIMRENQMRFAPGSTSTPAPRNAHERQMAKSPRTPSASARRAPRVDLDHINGAGLDAKCDLRTADSQRGPPSRVHATRRGEFFGRHAPAFSRDLGEDERHHSSRPALARSRPRADSRPLRRFGSCDVARLPRPRPAAASWPRFTLTNFARSQFIDKFESTALGARNDTEPVSRATNVESRNYYAASPGGHPAKTTHSRAKAKISST